MTEVFFALLLLLSLRLVQNLPINATSVNDCGNDNLQCTVAGSVKVVKAAAKLFIPINTVEVPRQFRSKHGICSIESKGRGQNYHVLRAHVLLFSSGPDAHSTERSCSFFNAMTAAVTKGDNTLGLEVWCVQMGCTGCTLVAKWSTRRIPQSPTDIPNWIHTRQITRTASLEPKCDQIPPKPEWVARHFK
ncbi:hypothetical protein C8R41DRAFT_867149 [Lentinula lateritia]|uniref:Secreted protein n=1 Tax=Lentinula lateritia TaxID=40482 RepID=A0ABQ8VFN4_9AGAR|nr:hypothetical protein C8R41DRAFT_867149 [Lentinula lateritia]